MADNANPRETCLYKISKFEGLHYFKNIFFFSSRQDSYAPFESARIEIHPDFMDAKDSLYGCYYTENRYIAKWSETF